MKYLGIDKIGVGDFGGWLWFNNNFLIINLKEFYFWLNLIFIDLIY